MSPPVKSQPSRSALVSAILYLSVAAIIAVALMMRYRHEKPSSPVIVHNLPLQILANFGHASLGSMPSSLAVGKQGDIYILTVTGGPRGNGMLSKYSEQTGKIAPLLPLCGGIGLGNAPPSNLVTDRHGFVYATQFTNQNSSTMELVSLFSRQTGTTPLITSSKNEILTIVGHHKNIIYLSGSDVNGTQPPRLLQYNLSNHSHSTLYTFAKPVTRQPGESIGSSCSSLVSAKRGWLYGVDSDTNFHGYEGFGDVFKISPKGSLTIDHVFSKLRYFLRNKDGANPVQLASDSNGNIYGITARGGSGGNGVLFSITPEDTFTVLHNFSATRNGKNRSGVHPTCIVVSPNGDVFGAADLGGLHQNGAIFCYLPHSHLFEVIHEFASAKQTTGQQEGAQPLALAFNTPDTLIGVTQFGGNFGGGTLFKLNVHGIH